MADAVGRASLHVGVPATMPADTPLWLQAWVITPTATRASEVETAAVR